MTDTRPWTSLAACLTQTHTMYPTRSTDRANGRKVRYKTPTEHDEAQKQALAICATCEVVDQCRNWGDRTELSPSSTFGILGGETRAQRIKRRTGRGDHV